MEEEIDGDIQPQTQLERRRDREEADFVFAVVWEENERERVFGKWRGEFCIPLQREKSQHAI